MERCVARTTNKLLANATGTFAFAGKKYCMVIHPLFLGSHLSKVHSSHAKIILTWYCNLSSQLVTVSFHKYQVNTSSYLQSIKLCRFMPTTVCYLQVKTLLSSSQLDNISHKNQEISVLTIKKSQNKIITSLSHRNTSRKRLKNLKAKDKKTKNAHMQYEQ